MAEFTLDLTTPEDALYGNISSIQTERMLYNPFGGYNVFLASSGGKLYALYYRSNGGNTLTTYHLLKSSSGKLRYTSQYRLSLGVETVPSCPFDLPFQFVDTDEELSPLASSGAVTISCAVSPSVQMRA